MSRMFTSALAAATVLVVSLAFVVFGVGAENVGAQLLFNATPVLVVNDAAAPVVVTDASKDRRIPWRQWTLIHLDNTDYRSEPVVTVPKGFRLFITDINVNACVELLRDTMAVNLTLWPENYPAADPNMPPPADEIPRTVVLLADRGVFRGMRHFGGTQQPNVFINEGETVWAEAYRTLGRRHGEAAVWVIGHLEPIAYPPGPTGPGW